MASNSGAVRPSTPTPNGLPKPDVDCLQLLEGNIYSCGFCDFTNDQEYFFARHISQHRFECFYNCFYCPTLCPTTDGITQHLQKAHPALSSYYSCLVEPKIAQIMVCLKKSYQVALQKNMASKAGQAHSKGLVGRTTNASYLTVNLDDDDDDGDDVVITGESRVNPRVPSSSPATSVTSDKQQRSGAGNSGSVQQCKTRPDCIYKKGMFVCNSCTGFESGNFIKFAKHVYKHIHHDDSSSLLNYCPSCTKLSSEPMECKIVSNMMGVLQTQQSLEQETKQKARVGQEKQDAEKRLPEGNERLENPKFGNSAIQAVEKKQIFPKTTTSELLIENDVNNPDVKDPFQIPITDVSRKLPTISSSAPMEMVKDEKLQYVPIIIEPVDSEPIVLEPDSPKKLSRNQTSHSIEAETSGSTVRGDGAKLKDTSSSEESDSNVTAPKLLCKCFYDKETDEFKCGKCKFAHSASRPKQFRIHLWHELHPNRQCNHCPPEIKFDKFSHCPVIKQIWQYLMEAKSKASAAIASAAIKNVKVINMVPVRKTDWISKQLSSMTRGTTSIPSVLKETELKKPENNTPVTKCEAESAPDVLEELEMVHSDEILVESQGNTSDSGNTCHRPKDLCTSVGPSSPIEELSNSPIPPETSSSEPPVSETPGDAPTSEDMSASILSGPEKCNEDVVKEQENSLDALLVISDVISEAEMNISSPKDDNEELLGELVTKSDDVKELNDEMPSSASSLLGLNKTLDKDQSILSSDNYPSPSVRDYGLLYNEKKGSRASPYVWNRMRKFHNPKPPPNTVTPHNTSQIYVCSFYRCSYWTTYDPASFKIHCLLNHKGSRNFGCAFCPRTFSTEDNLVVHTDELVHREPTRTVHFRPFQCGIPECWAVNDREVDFIEHNQFNHSEEVEFPCIYCGLKFSKVLELINHIARNVSYYCTKCDVHCVSNVGMKTHILHGNTLEHIHDLDVKLHIKCAEVEGQDSEGGKEIVRVIHVKDTPIVSAQAFPISQDGYMQESFKCTKCSLVTDDEAYFEEHVVQCMKSSTSKTNTDVPKPPLAKAVNRRKSPPVHREWDGNDCEVVEHSIGNSTVIEKETRAAETEKSPREKPVDDNVPFDDQRTGIVETGDLPPLESPLNPPRTTKTVLQSLGKGLTVKCEKCSFTTEFRVVMAIHERLHLGDQDKTKFLWCPNCPFSADSTLNFKIHMQGHAEKSKIRLYNCAYCILSSNQMDLVEDHHEEAHPESEFKLEVTRLAFDEVLCPHCAQSLKSESEYLSHLEEHGTNDVHKYLKSMYSIASLQIMEDTENATTALDVPNPIEEHILHEDENIVEDIEGGNGEDPEQGSERFQCPHCTYSCHKCGTWIRHLQRHVAGGKQQVLLYCCKTCKWKSTSKRKVIDHCKVRHNEIIFEIQNVELSGDSKPSADFADEQNNELQVPVSLDKICKYHCELCDYSTNLESILKEHMVTHEGETTLSMIDNPDDVDCHDDSSNMEDVYMYDKGPNSGVNELKEFFASRDSVTLIDDLLVQLYKDERRPTKDIISCPICPYSSDVKRNMRRHLQVHKNQATITKGFKCGYCMYISQMEGVVTKHIKQLHPNLPVKKIPVGNAAMKEDLLPPMNMMDTFSHRGKNAPSNPSETSSDPKETMGIQVENVWSQSADDCESVGIPAFTISAVVGSDGSTGQIHPSISGSSEKVSNPPIEHESFTIVQTARGDRSQASNQQDTMDLCCEEIQGRNLFKCTKCFFMHQEPTYIISHFKLNHKEHLPYQCGYCPLKASTPAEIKNHSSVDHKEVPAKVLDIRNAHIPTGNDLFEREECEDALHVSDIPLEESLSTYIINDGSHFICKFCDLIESQAAILAHHIMVTHLRYYPFKCKHCAFAASNAGTVLGHTDNFHPGLERKVVQRKLPEVLPDSNESVQGVVTSAIIEENQMPTGTAARDGDAPIPIKVEPLSDNEEDNYSDNSYRPGGVGERGSVSPEIGGLPFDEWDVEDGQDPLYTPPQKRSDRQSSKIYRCGLCDYTSRWNLADVRLHVLCVHLRIHPYSCPFCCFGSPRRGKLIEHFRLCHPDKEGNPDEAKDEVQSALTTYEKNDSIYITLGRHASVIRNAYLPNVKTRSGMSTSFVVHKTVSEDLNNRHKRSCPSIYRRSDDDNVHSQYTESQSRTSLTPERPSSAEKNSGLGEQPLDLRTNTPSFNKVRTSLVPGKNTHVLKVPSAPTFPLTNVSPQSAALPSNRPVSDEPSTSAGRRTYTLYKCRSCGRGYVQKIKAQYHFTLKHLNLYPYICNYCGFGENARKRVVDHILKEHPQKEIVVFAAFREHALVQKKVFPVKVDVSEYEGVMRSTKFISDSGYLHKKEKFARKNIRCSLCVRTLHDQEALDKHMSTDHHEYNGFRCYYCGVYIKAKQKMKYHLDHRHANMEPKYHAIKHGSPCGDILTNFNEIVRRTPLSTFPPSKGAFGTGRLRIAFPFNKKKPGFFNLARKKIGSNSSGYADKPQNLEEDETLEMRMPTHQPGDDGYNGKSTPKMIKPRSDVVGGTVWLLCNYCNYSTLTSTLMRHHVMSHINYRPYKCPYCGFAGVRTHQVKKHIRSQHKNMPDKPKYVSDPEIERNLTEHFSMKVRKVSESANMNDSMLRQPSNRHEDGSPPANKKIKMESEASEDGSSTGASGSTRKIDGNRETAAPQEDFVCVLCSVRKPNRSSLLRHIMWELDYRPWHCPHCDYRDVTLGGVKIHAAKLHPDMPFKMVLKQDHKSMSRIHTLVEQSKKIAKSPTVKREQNNIGFVKSSLEGNNEVRPSSQGTHIHDVSAMGAPQDSSVITSAAELENSEKNLSGEHRVYSCKNCTFKSTVKNCFKKHLLRHGPKRFKCGYCNQASVFKGELHKHLNRMHRKRPYKIVSLMDNMSLTTKTVTKNSQSLDIRFPNAGSTNEESRYPSGRRPLGLSVDPLKEGGIMAMLEAELSELENNPSENEEDTAKKEHDKGDGMDTSAQEDNVETGKLDSSSQRENSATLHEAIAGPLKRLGVYNSKVRGVEDGVAPDDAVAVIDGIVLTKEHMILTAEGMFVCQHCNYSSPHRENSKIHVARHFPLRWKCAHCDVKHQLSYELRRHIRKTHPGLSIKMVKLKTIEEFVPNTLTHSLNNSPVVDKKLSPGEGLHTSTPAVAQLLNAPKSPFVSQVHQSALKKTPSDSLLNTPLVLEEETEALSTSEKTKDSHNTPDRPRLSATPDRGYRPGPACSKKKKPLSPGGGIPSIFCCFYCTFKTDNTLELVQHQKLHADGEKQGKSPRSDVGGTLSSTESPTAKSLIATKTSSVTKAIIPAAKSLQNVSESSQGDTVATAVVPTSPTPSPPAPVASLPLPPPSPPSAAPPPPPPTPPPTPSVPLTHKCGFCSFSTTDKHQFTNHRQTHTVIKPYKCAHCSYSGFVKSKVKDHCSRMHPDLLQLVIAQSQPYCPSPDKKAKGKNVSVPEPWKKQLGGPKYVNSIIKTKDVLKLPQPELERLLKIHQLIGINW